jgi:hypothetical protein
MGNPRDHAEIVGDQQHGNAEIALKVDGQAEDRLNRDVEGVVGSFAIATAGPHISAIAITIRWRNRTEN